MKEARFAADTALAKVYGGGRIAVGIAAGFLEVRRAEAGAVYSNGLIVSIRYIYIYIILCVFFSI